MIRFYFILSPYYLINYLIVVSYFIFRQYGFFPEESQMLHGDYLTGIPRVNEKNAFYKILFSKHSFFRS